MVISDLEIIDLDRVLQQLMLDFFDYDILAIDEDEDITRAEMRSIRPALNRAIERVRRCCNDLLAVHEDVRQFTRLVYISLNNLL